MRNATGVQYDYRIGEVYGRLTITGYSYIIGVGGYRRRFVEAICACGHIDRYVYDYLQKGSTRSCGCLQKDLLKQFPHRITHGLSKHPLFKVFDGMNQRCSNPNFTDYQYWGGKGIKVCDEWKGNFKAFYDWAMVNGYKKGLTIDRIKSDKDYEPSNCRFITPRQQRMNMEGLHMITAFGETKCMADWVLDKRCKITRAGLKNRLGRDKADWPDIEKAITTPPQIRGFNIENRAVNKMLTAFGETKSIADWVKDERCVIDEKTIRSRLRHIDRETMEVLLTRKQRKSPTVKHQPVSKVDV